MIRADVLVDNNSWKKYIRNPNIYIKNRLKKVEKKINMFKKNKFKFTLLLSDHKEIKELNKKFRKKNKTTDILSFPFHQKKFLNKLLKKNKIKIYLGDIIINLNKIKYFKKNENFPLNFDKIWVHGLVHLLGHRHKSNFDYFIMKKLENKLLQSVI